MGTRGLMAFAHNGEVKGMYNHFDSYPSGLGEDLVQFILKQDGNFDEAKELFKNLVAVDEEVPPTEDQKLALLRYYDPKVSTGRTDEWYSLLRETQGNPEATLKAGFYVDGKEFAKDSLFCEWGYVIDFDREVLEVYRGFQNDPHNEGRFAQPEPGYVSPGYGEGPTNYYTIRLFTEISFSKLEKKETMSAIEKTVYEEDDED